MGSLCHTGGDHRNLNLLVIGLWNSKFPSLKLVCKMVFSFPRTLPLSFQRMLQEKGKSWAQNSIHVCMAGGREGGKCSDNTLRGE